jgi:hypothetical protein
MPMNACMRARPTEGTAFGDRGDGWQSLLRSRGIPDRLKQLSRNMKSLKRRGDDGPQRLVKKFITKNARACWSSPSVRIAKHQVSDSAIVRI